MTGPQRSVTDAYASDANDLSILLADVLPRSAPDVGIFVSDVAFALAQREADLARTLGVSRGTLAGWKARGAIPASHLHWFTHEFVYAVLTAPPAPHFDLRHVGLNVALRVFERTAFDPFGLQERDIAEKIGVCYRYLGGLARLGLFLMRRLEICPTDPDGPASERLAALAKASAPRLIAERKVSH